MHSGGCCNAILVSQLSGVGGPRPGCSPCVSVDHDQINVVSWKDWHVVRLLSDCTLDETWHEAPVTLGYCETPLRETGLLSELPDSDACVVMLWTLRPYHAVALECVRWIAFTQTSCHMTWFAVAAAPMMRSVVECVQWIALVQTTCLMM